MKTNLAKRFDEVQNTAVDRAIEFLETEGKCLIVMATGTGKTMVGSKIIKAHHDKKILWLTQTQELINQTRLELQKIFGENNVGLFQRQQQDTEQMIVVASVQTIERDEYRKKLSPHLFDLLIVDEAHHARAGMWEKVINYFDCKKLGLTATPIRHDGLGLEVLFGESAFHLGYEEAKRLRLISEEIYRVIITNSRLAGVTTRTSDYKPRDLDRLVISRDRNNIILESYLKYGRPFMKKLGLPYKTICFCISVAHALRMKELFQDAGIRSDILVGTPGKYATQRKVQTQKERQEVFQSYVDGSGAEILCVVNILNEGKNIPNVGCLLLARPTRSNIIFQQQLGRGCRRIEGVKEKYVVLDFVDLINQKYPPMTLSRWGKQDYTPNQIVLDYYRGKDPIVVDEYVKYLSSNYEFSYEPLWTKEKVLKTLRDYNKKHGGVSTRDLVPTKTGLPTKTTIRRLWPSLKTCFDEAGISGYRAVTPWTKEECAKALQTYFHQHGKIRIEDLGSKNNLPSQKTVYGYWGTWMKCANDLQFRDPFWSRKKNVLAALRKFMNHKKKDTITKDVLGSQNGLPSLEAVEKHFGTLEEALEQARSRTNWSHMASSLGKTKYKGVWNHQKGGYRSEVFHRGKRYNVGYFSTPELARDAYLQKAKELGKTV